MMNDVAIVRNSRMSRSMGGLLQGATRTTTALDPGLLEYVSGGLQEEGNGALVGRAVLAYAQAERSRFSDATAFASR